VITVEENEIGTQLAPLQIIVGALVVGVVTFGVVSLFLGPLAPEDQATARLLLLILGAVGIAEAAGFLIIRMGTIMGLQRAAGVGEGDSGGKDRVLVAYRSLVLIRAAMCEGFTMFALVIVLLHGERLALGAAAVGLLLLIAGIPTPGRCARFIESVAGRNPYGA
jgi:hypothetical protein